MPNWTDDDGRCHFGDTKQPEAAPLTPERIMDSTTIAHANQLLHDARDEAARLRAKLAKVTKERDAFDSEVGQTLNRLQSAHEELARVTAERDELHRRNEHHMRIIAEDRGR